jgi:hypothetical protein
VDLPGDLPSLAARGAGAIHRAFDEHHRAFRAITERVRRRFEERDWEGIRRDTVEKLELPSRSLDETIAILSGQLGDRLCDRGIWGAMKAAYTREILGRDDFEIARPISTPSPARSSRATASIPPSTTPPASSPSPSRGGRWRAPASTPSAGWTPG